MLSGTELIFVGKSSVVAKDGSIIVANGTYASAPTPDLILDPGTAAAANPASAGAAILAVSNGAKPNLQRGSTRTGPLTALVDVTINDGVTISAGNSILIDGRVVNLAFGPRSKLSANAVQIGSNHISIGDITQAQANHDPGGTHQSCGPYCLVADQRPHAAAARQSIFTGRSRSPPDRHRSTPRSPSIPPVIRTSNAGNTATVAPAR